ncbi:hypothetical protein NP493_172g01031 [Ridgeia piscesae]|uniref:Uncharacterized protein n=1 Tax=Ridgeia piscesae TaxID=27915 RepID=A0AAD9P2Z9_RIDPI|nr:hypothetical protein NP493_172g01031 [Ridgeia piscesae]
MSLLERVVLLLLVTSFSLPEPTNEDCNTNVTECEETENDSCYTLIVKTATFGRRYTKGCTNMLRCRKLQALNNRKTCPYIPSDCIYCCDDKANCNAYNTAPVSPRRLLPLCSRSTASSVATQRPLWNRGKLVLRDCIVTLEHGEC